jgi:CBS domain containing-hemolysin-like protein
MALFAECGHSRMPVYRDTLDTITGMIHIKRRLRDPRAWRAHPETLDGLIRDPLYVPQSAGALDLLAEMRQKRTHLAIVLDEYSGTDGLVTIEDLVEEIVGDIEDEHDDAPEAMLVPLEGGAWDATRGPNSTMSPNEIDPGSPRSIRMSIRWAASRSSSPARCPWSAIA